MNWLLFFFFNDTATTEIYTLSLHDALPICPAIPAASPRCPVGHRSRARPARPVRSARSEEHTSELQSQLHLVCRLLLEKKNWAVSGGQPPSGANGGARGSSTVCPR